MSDKPVPPTPRRPPLPRPSSPTAPPRSFESEPSEPFDDHARPTDDGYGYYEVDEYVGDPLLRPPSVEPDELLTDIALRRPLFSRPDFDPPDAAAMAVPVRGEGDVADEPGIADRNLESDAAHGADMSGDSGRRVDGNEPLPPIVRSGRVSFAERNWRIPTIIALVVAMIVIGTVILLLPDDGIVEQDTSELVELRTQPSKQWDEDLDGFASGVAFDGDTLYAVVGRRSGVEVVAIELSDGDERWRTELGPGGEASVGDVALADGELTVVVDSGSGPGVLAALDAESGTVGWQIGYDGEESAIVADDLVRSTEPDGGTVLRPIDRENERLGPATPAAMSIVDGERIFVDDGRVLTRRSLSTLELDDGFEFRHTGEIAASTFVGGDLIVAVGEQVIRLDDTGAEQFSYDPDVGVVRSLLSMQGDALAVGGTGRTRIVTINSDDAEPVTDVRTSLSAIAVVVIDGEERILGVIPSGTGGAATLRVVRVSDASLETVAEIGVTGGNEAAPIVVVNDIVYATSSEAVPRFVAADLGDGERLWSFALIEDDDTAVVTETGVVLLTDEDDETVVTYFAADD